MFIFLLLPLIIDSAICYNDPKSVNLEFETSIHLDPTDLLQPKTYLRTAQGMWDSLRQSLTLRSDDNENIGILPEAFKNVFNSKYFLRTATKFWNTFNTNFRTEKLLIRNGDERERGNIGDIPKNKLLLRTALNIWNSLKNTVGSTNDDEKMSGSTNILRTVQSFWNKFHTKYALRHNDKGNGESIGLADVLDGSNFLRSAQNVFSSLQDAMLPTIDDKPEIKIQVLNDDETTDNDRVLTKFFLDLGMVLLKYDNNALKDLINVLHKEARRYYKIGPFNPVLFNPKLKDLVMKTLREWAINEPAELKAKAKHFMSHTKNSLKSHFVKTMNQFFNANDAEKLDSIIYRLDANSRQANKAELTDIVKDAIRVLILDRYANMNEKTKAKFGNKLIKMAEKISQSELVMLNIFKKAVDHTFRRLMQELISNNSIADNSQFPQNPMNDTAPVKNNSSAIPQIKNQTQQKDQIKKIVTEMNIHDGAEKFVKSMTSKPEKSDSKPFVEFY